MKKCFTKPSKLMKICAAQAMLVLIVCGVSAAHDNYAQLLDRKITLSLKEVPFEVALKRIESASRVRMFYSIDQLDINESVSIEAKDETLRAVLDDLLAPYNIKYKVNANKRAVILKRQTEAEARDETSSNELPWTSGMQSPFSVITGTVSDAITQQPMAGVNIIVKGTTIGTTTDSEGKYNIEAGEDDVLVFSFIGYATYETSVSGRSAIDVSLQEDATDLGEVVVNAGYWQVTDREKTGNIVKIEAEEIQKQPVQNPLAALQGRIAGLEITQSTGVPGGNFKVRIRGTNSIANGNDPLFIIDGVPYTTTPMTFGETSRDILALGTSPLNSINPADIESIEVLKDADATAIYGSRGSNGVILISTKKGRAGKTKVGFNLYTGGGKLARTLDMLNTREYLEMRKEAFRNDNVTPTVANARDLVVWDTTRNSDWQKELIGGTAQATDVQVSVSGGDTYTQFSFGTGYHKETTVFPGDNSDQRVSSRLNVTNITLNNKLRTSISVNYALNDTDLLNRDLTSRAIFLPPNAPTLYDEKGEISWDGWDPSGPYENPVGYLKRRYEAESKNLIASAEVAFAILHNLELKSRMGYTNTGMNTFNLVPISSLPPSIQSSSQNSTDFSNSTFENWMIEPQVNWKPKLGGGLFDVLIGTQFLNQATEGLAQKATGFSSEALMKNIAAAPNRVLGTNYFSQYRYYAVFGRVNYNYNGKYIINITGRRDGSSRFGPKNQFANFGAVGAAWIFSKETFTKDHVPFISFGKVRSSYGITGNDQLTDYQYLDAYSSSSGVQQEVIGLYPVRLSNPNFAWETNEKMEVGLELGIWKDRVLTNLSYYRNLSSNQLVGYPLPPTTGFTSIQANFPATVQNTGIEIELNTVNLRNDHFTWNTSLNISIPSNKLVDFPNLAATPAYANRYVVGEPLTIAKTFFYLGIDPITGVYQFVDTNQDLSLDSEDKQTIKFVGPQFYGGVQNTFSYKGFQFDLFFQFTRQTGRNYIYTTATPGYMLNQPKYVLNRWQTEGDNADTQRFGQSSEASTAYSRIQESDKSVGDASFIRLKNLSISYALPSQYTDKLAISNLRLFIHGQNLLTISNYKGLDPETQASSLPPLRVLTGGMSLTF